MPDMDPSQPTPHVSHSDVERVVLRDFSPSERANAFATLDEYGRETWEHAGRHRVQLAALKLADGDLSALRDWIRAARTDFRDVVAAAEYPAAFSVDWSRLSGMSNTEQQRLYDADWQQYCRWLERA